MAEHLWERGAVMGRESNSGRGDAQDRAVHSALSPRAAVPCWFMPMPTWERAARGTGCRKVCCCWCSCWPHGGRRASGER